MSLLLPTQYPLLLLVALPKSLQELFGASHSSTPTSYPRWQDSSSPQGFGSFDGAADTVGEWDVVGDWDGATDTVGE